MAVERAQHERETSEVTRGDAPAFRQRAGRASFEAPLKTNERSDPKSEAVVEDDHCRQLVACRSAGKPQAMIAVCVFDQEVKAIYALQSYASGVDISGQRSLSFRVAIGRRDESQAKRHKLRTPDQGIAVSGEDWIADKHAAPAIGEFAQRGFVRDRARIDALHHACIVLAIFGIAAEKLQATRERSRSFSTSAASGDRQCLVLGMQGPPRSKALHEGGAKAIGEAIGRGSPCGPDARCT
jgi:hypothetical protein